MITWNYRLMKDDETGEYGLHEVYYGPDKEPGTYTTVAVAPGSDEETLKEAKKSIRWQLKKMLKALDKPVLTSKDFDL